MVVHRERQAAAILTVLLAAIVFAHSSSALRQSHSAAPSSTQISADNSKHPDEVLTQVGFGSCSRHNLDQSYWPYVTAALTTNEAPTLHQPLTPVSHCPAHGPSDRNSRKKNEKLTGQDGKKDTKGTTGKAEGDDGCVDGFVWLGDVIYGDTSPFYGIWYPSAYSVIRDKFVAFRENPFYSAFVDTVKRYSGSSVVVPPADLVASVFDERDQQDKATPSPSPRSKSHDLKSKVDTEKAKLSKVEDKAEKRTPHAAAGVKLDGPVVSPRRVVGVWDDHDMGKNNGGAEFEDRDQNQQLFLDFLDTPELSPRRARKGLYSVSGVPFRGSSRGSSSSSNSASKSAQPLGTSKSAQSMEAALSSAYDFAVCNVLLDVRYYADLETDLLGEPQWAWLDEVITGGPALDAELGLDEKIRESHRGAKKQRGRRSLSDRCLFTMIGTGIQVISDEKPTEHWGQYPGARQRLLSLLRKRKMERFVFISGDVHMGEVQTVAPFFEQFREKPPQWGAGPLKIPVIDVTSSGMTHSVSSIPFLSIAGLENIFPSVRVRAHYLKKNFGTVTLTAKRLSKPRKGQSATKEHSDGSTSLEQVEVTAALCVHRVEDGAAVIRYDVDIFNDLSLTEANKLDQQQGSPVMNNRESTPHWQRPSASKETLEKEFGACPYKCDLSTVPLPPIRQLFVTIHRSLPFKVQLPTVIYGTVATTVVLCMCIVGFVVRRCFRTCVSPLRAMSVSPKAKEE